MLICNICYKTLPNREFYARMSTCKGCWISKVKKRRRLQPKVQEYDRERSKTTERRALGAINSKKWREQNPEGISSAECHKQWHSR